MTWIKANAKYIGLLLLFVVGPMIALLGKRCFPWISALIGAVIVIPLVIFLSSGQGWLDTDKGFWIVFVIAVLAGLLTAFILHRSVWIGVGLIGIYTGWTIGFLIYGALLASFGWHSIWGSWAIRTTLAIAGGALAFKYGRALVIIGTSIIGSYMFTRGLTLVFDPEFPTEE